MIQRLIDRDTLLMYLTKAFGEDLRIKARIHGEGEFLDADLGAFLRCVPDYDVDLEEFLKELKERANKPRM